MWLPLGRRICWWYAPSGDTETKDWWLSPLYEALYPENHRRTMSDEAPGCPRIGNETVLNAPLHSAVGQIRPGAHKPRAGKHMVAWFDPAVLRLQDPASQGYRARATVAR